jgi:hypothetical protein
MSTTTKTKDPDPIPSTTSTTPAPTTTPAPVKTAKAVAAPSPASAPPPAVTRFCAPGTVKYLTYPPGIDWTEDQNHLPVIASMSMGQVNNPADVQPAIDYFEANGCAPGLTTAQITPIVNRNGGVIGFQAPLVTEIVT